MYAMYLESKSACKE